MGLFFVDRHLRLRRVRYEIHPSSPVSHSDISIETKRRKNSGLGADCCTTTFPNRCIACSRKGRESFKRAAQRFVIRTAAGSKAVGDAQFEMKLPGTRHQ